MQRISHDFNVLASREPTGRLCPALSEREREIQQIARPCRNASTQASHGWRATRRSGGGPRLRKRLRMPRPAQRQTPLVTVYIICVYSNLYAVVRRRPHA
ncbi:hypothetical protein BBTM_01859 [Bifidobacterium bifidum]|nr:hypothetical protein BBTM_01859 [Bifidobacterium bifidum]